MQTVVEMLKSENSPIFDMPVPFHPAISPLGQVKPSPNSSFAMAYGPSLSLSRSRYSFLLTHCQSPPAKDADTYCKHSPECWATSRNQQGSAEPHCWSPVRTPQGCVLLHACPRDPPLCSPGRRGRLPPCWAPSAGCWQSCRLWLRPWRSQWAGPGPSCT